MAISKMNRQCKEDNLEFGDLNLAEWRVYNLHRSSMKTKENKRATGIQWRFRSKSPKLICFSYRFVCDIEASLVYEI